MPPSLVNTGAAGHSEASPVTPSDRGFDLRKLKRATGLGAITSMSCVKILREGVSSPFLPSRNQAATRKTTISLFL